MDDPRDAPHWRLESKAPSLWLVGTALCCALAAPLLASKQERANEDTRFDSPEELQRRFRADVEPFLAAHCAECHSGLTPEGGLDLTRYLGPNDVVAAQTVLRHAIERVQRGQMPPPSRTAPSAEAISAFAAAVARINRSAYDPSRGIDPGPSPLRRLTNTEYENSVFDTLGVRFDATGFFPADAIGHGFDNVAEAQHLSELLLERYLEAAHTIAGRAIAWEPVGEPIVHSFRGVELSGGRSRDESRVLTTNGECTIEVVLPRRGTYLFRATVHAEQAGRELARMELRRGGELVGAFDVVSKSGALPEDHEQSFTVDEGGPVIVAVAFTNDFYVAEGERRADRNLHVHGIEIVGPLGPPEPTALQVQLTERYADVRSQKERTQLALTWLAERLWRRPATSSEVARLAALAPRNAPFEQVLQIGLSAALASPNFVFRLENREPTGPTPRALDGFELATRLSYFLWSAPPDDALRELARSGELLDRDTLRAQVRRMLDDPKSGNLARNFAAQWLETRRLAKHSVDPERFPEANAELFHAMERETLLVFEAILRERRSILDLLDADFTFVNDALAVHYGLPPVEGSFMRRVGLEGTGRRGILLHASILTVTSEPDRTSPVKRGKWVLEKLLASPLPPPPPGADSFGDDDPAELSAAGLRERIAMHRSRADCASCHDHLDPIGFGLEAYDAIGRTRTRTRDGAIDTSGVLPGGAAFDGALELLSAIRAYDHAGDWYEGPSLVRGVVEQLLVYALGRGLEPSDRPTIGAILEQLDRGHPTLLDAITAIVTSDAFTMRRVGAKQP